MKHYLRLWNKRVEEFSDWVANLSSKPSFILAHIVWWAVWMIFKVEVFPYGLLTLIVSLEAIILSSLILSSSNREGEQEKQISRKTLRSEEHTSELQSH